MNSDAFENQNHHLTYLINANQIISSFLFVGVIDLYNFENSSFDSLNLFQKKHKLLQQK
jgi:hypothetical protein